MPKFQDLASWQQAEQLMQPAFIRLIDNIRKQLEQSDWQGRYEEVPVWSEDVSDSVKSDVMQLMTQLKQAAPEEAIGIEQALAHLPAPHLGYYLNLTRQDQQVTVDLWQVCYQICFQDYDPLDELSHGAGEADARVVQIDTRLFEETGDVDWNRLDDKTQRLVEGIFAALPEQ